jgi:hypothetical protein
MLIGSKIPWHNIPILDAGPASALSNLTTITNLAFGSSIGNLPQLPDALGDVQETSIFKDRHNKFHVIFVDPDVAPIANHHNGQLVYQSYYLGRYEREDEANKVIQRVRCSIKYSAIGIFIDKLPALLLNVGPASTREFWQIQYKTLLIELQRTRTTSSRKK